MRKKILAYLIDNLATQKITRRFRHKLDWYKQPDTPDVLIQHLENGIAYLVCIWHSDNF